MLGLLLCASSAQAQTGTKKTPTALNAEVNVSYADNHTGAITPSTARQVTLDQNASIPFLLTTNIFSAYQGINLNGVSLPAPQSGTLLQGSAAATFVSRFELDSFGASSHFSGVRANGTVGSPTTLINGSEIVSLNAFGYNGLANVGPFAAFRCFADQTWASGSAAGTYCDIATTPDNSTTMASIVKFNNDGGVVFGAATGGDKGSGTLNAVGLYINGVAAGNVSSVSNSDSTLTISPTTGSVVASLNLAHANTWGATQAFAAITATTFNGNAFTAGTGTLTLGAAKTATINNSLTMVGTDGTTQTFPSTSATVARTDAAQTFTGNQTFSGSVLSTSPSAGEGYTTGAGGAVTQLTSRTTAVTLNTMAGAITLFTASPGTTNTWVNFTVNDSSVGANDVPHVAIRSNNNTYVANVSAVVAGAFQISFMSIANTNSDTPVINFTVTKGSIN